MAQNRTSTKSMHGDKKSFAVTSITSDSSWRLQTVIGTSIPTQAMVLTTMLTDFEKEDSAFFSIYSYTREECTSQGYLTGKCRTLTLSNGLHRSVSSVVIFWRNALKGTNAARPCAMKTTNLLIAKLHATCGYGHEPENRTAVARSRQKRLSCSRQTQVRKRAENCKGFFKRRSHLDAFSGHCFGYRWTRNYSPGNQEPCPPSRLKHGSDSGRERRAESQNYSLLSGERL